MGTSLIEGGDADLRDGLLTTFYSSDAWIDVRAEDQLTQVAGWPGVTRMAAFPDLHPGKHGPVGCAVLADRIYPQLIGTDIGCGMSLFQLDLPLRKLKLDKAERRLRALGEPPDINPCERLQAAGLHTTLAPEALGTIGGGNHFCEVQVLADPVDGCPLPENTLCLLVHSGSRKLGAATLADHMTPGTATADADGYVRAHDVAVRWATLNRQLIAERAADALRCSARLVADVPHNLLTQTPQGWLHRKGAAVAAPLVPLAGSRATASYLLHSTAPAEALASLAHGAGRRYDRASMHGRVRRTATEMAAMARNRFGGRLICEDRDLMIEEAPKAYKDAAQVVADLAKTGVATRVATLNPLLTFKKTRTEDPR